MRMNELMVLRINVNPLDKSIQKKKKKKKNSVIKTGYGFGKKI